MKKMLANPILMMAALLLVCLWPVTTRAQAEPNPEAYPPSNGAPANSSIPMKQEFKGKFSLKDEVQCGGHKLAPGEYTLIVKTVGDKKMVTIQREGSDVVLTVSKTAPPTAAGSSAVIVRHGPGPGKHTLEAVYCETLNMMLYLDESGCTKAMDKMFAGTKRVPIS